MSSYDDTYECDGIALSLRFDFYDIAQKVPHVDIKILSCQDHYNFG